MTQELPAGTVTFLFTDIEGSTRLLRELGDRYEHVRSEHDGLLRQAAAAHDGQEVDNQGDSFFFSFRRAKDAVAAAADAQRALFEHPWPDAAALRVRMGIHTGEPVVGADGRYVGLSVHRAARIGAAAQGGQVLLSSTTADLVADSLPDGITLRKVGRHSLKDFDRPEQISQLVVDGLQNDFRPARTGRDRRRRIRALVAAAAVAVAAGTAAALVVSNGSTSPKPAAVAANSVAVIDPRTNRVVGDVPAGTTPSVVAGQEGIWTMNTGDGTVSRIDPKTYSIQTHPFSSAVTGIATGFGKVWAADPSNGTIAPLDPLYGETGQAIRITRPLAVHHNGDNGSPGPIAVGFGSLWVGVSVPTSELVRVDPHTGAILSRIHDVNITFYPETADSVAVGEGAVWIASPGDDTVIKVDPTSDLIVGRTTVDYSNFDDSASIAVGNGAVWATVPSLHEVVRIDASSQSVQTIPVGVWPTGIAVGEGSVWVTNEDAGTVSRIDPLSSRVIATITVGHYPGSVAIADGRVWIGVGAHAPD
jgi:YVTN family beta-propeller protein